MLIEIISKIANNTILLQNVTQNHVTIEGSEGEGNLASAALTNWKKIFLASSSISPIKRNFFFLTSEDNFPARCNLF